MGGCSNLLVCIHTGLLLFATAVLVLAVAAAVAIATSPGNVALFCTTATCQQADGCNS